MPQPKNAVEKSAVEFAAIATNAGMLKVASYFVQVVPPVSGITVVIFAFFTLSLR
jgi:hypothetical protein